MRGSNPANPPQTRSLPSHMKFPQLPIGARFRWRDAEYTKNGPVTAEAQADKSSRMIPRSASVAVIDAAPAATQPQPIASALLQSALSDCQAEVKAACGALSEAERDNVESALAAAHERLLSRLGIE